MKTGACICLVGTQKPGKNANGVEVGGGWDRGELAESEKNGIFVGYETGSGYHILLAANRGERGAAMG